MRLVLLSQFFWHQAFAGAPDEIHFRVRGAERQPRLKNQEHAAVKKKESTDESHRHRNPRDAPAEKCDHADRHAGSHEHANGRIRIEVSTESSSDRVGEVSSLNDQSTIQLLEPHFARSAREITRIISSFSL